MANLDGLPSGLSQRFARVFARRKHPFLTERGRELGADADDRVSSFAIARAGGQETTAWSPKELRGRSATT